MSAGNANDGLRWNTVLRSSPQLTCKLGFAGLFAEVRQHRLKRRRAARVVGGLTHIRNAQWAALPCRRAGAKGQDHRQPA
jgi:hypothetical protein